MTMHVLADVNDSFIPLYNEEIFVKLHESRYVKEPSLALPICAKFDDDMQARY